MRAVVELRWWAMNQLLTLARWVCPSRTGKREKHWQVIEVPRRITMTEARQIAEQVRNL